jgi:hypothetical protein
VIRCIYVAAYANLYSLVNSLPVYLIIDVFVKVTETIWKNIRFSIRRSINRRTDWKTEMGCIWQPCSTRTCTSAFKSKFSLEFCFSLDFKYNFIRIRYAWILFKKLKSRQKFDCGAMVIVYEVKESSVKIFKYWVKPYVVTEMYLNCRSTDR